MMSIKVGYGACSHCSLLVIILEFMLNILMTRNNHLPLSWDETIQFPRFLSPCFFLRCSWHLCNCFGLLPAHIIWTTGWPDMVWSPYNAPLQLSFDLFLSLVVIVLWMSRSSPWWMEIVVAIYSWPLTEKEATFL